MPVTLLVTGGLGYIGSHVCIELLARGYELVVLDSLCNSKIEVLSRIEALSGKRVTLVKADVRDYRRLQETFQRFPIAAVLHFAGLKAVGESVQEPVRYYRNNIHSALTLCQVMEEFGVKRLIFSSSATVYGNAGAPPFDENAPLAPTNPYGQAKFMVEQILTDTAWADPEWRICSLRYFNPVGAHPSGLLGEDPNGIPNNLMPYVCQVALGRQEKLQIYGGDYPTPDGTGIRDYIHVTDLAKGHVAALEELDAMEGMTPVNLGTGRGYSVLEVVQAFQLASGRRVPYSIIDRRPGDVAINYADPTRSHSLLKWRAEKGLHDMCADAWRWQLKNPNGYVAALARSINE
jgi:UDP-glucose 4-epimerase